MVVEVAAAAAAAACWAKLLSVDPFQYLSARAVLYGEGPISWVSDDCRQTDSVHWVVCIKRDPQLPVTS